MPIHPPSSLPPHLSFLPPSKARSWISFFILLFLLGHISIPLAYYVVPSSPSDERFRWRMFSGRRMMSCSIQMTAHKQQPNGTSFPETIALQRHLQYSWVNLLQQGRPAVIEKALTYFCQQAGMSEVHFSRQCRGVGSVVPGKPAPQTSTEARLICASKKLTWQGDR